MVAVIDLFSKRKKRAEQTSEQDIYTYDTVPVSLRIQIIHIWRDLFGVIGPYSGSGVTQRWEFLHNSMAREKAIFVLAQSGYFDQRCSEWFVKTATDEDAIDMIELSFRLAVFEHEETEEWKLTNEGVKVRAQDAIDELNERFREHGVGYQFEEGNLVRLDNLYVHSEVVKPALTVLSQASFQKANEDFLLAHKNYREGRHKDCIVAAQRSFESTLKTVCEQQGWPFKPGDRVSELVTVVRNHGLFPDYLNRGFDTYVALLKTGLPDVRNNAGGHGEAPNAPSVPPYIAAYALHTTATNIVMVVDAANAASSR